MTPASDAIFTRPLHKPITGHGETIAEISFREPVAADIARFGNPVKFNPFLPDEGVDFHADRMTAMMAHLAGINPAAIGQMSTQDWTSCAWGIAGFFMPVVVRPTSTSQST